MSEQKQKIYVKGSMIKARQTSFGEVLNVSLKVSELVELAKEWNNEKGYLNLNILPRKEVGQYGDTHSLLVDTWQPGDKSSQPEAKSQPVKKTVAKKAAAAPAEPEEDEVPF